MRLLGALFLVLALPLSARQQLVRHEAAVSFGQTSFETGGEAPAAGLSYNRFWTRVASTRAGFFTARKDDPRQHFHALYASAEYHPFRGLLVSPRVSGGIVRAWSETDAEITFIAAAGVDFRITPRFALGAEFVHVPHTPNSRDRFAAAWDPQTVFVTGRFGW